VNPSHRPILGTQSRSWPDEPACAADATALARQGGDALADAVIRLDGPLGAGKTTFVRHLLRALGIGGRVRSPTYALMEPYTWRREAGRLPVTVSHFDFYRFADPDEWVSAGFRDVFAEPGLKLVEWGAQVGALLPAADLSLDLQPDPQGGRHVVACAHSRRGLDLLTAWPLEPGREDPAPRPGGGPAA
jgi:tRNA threonylcarbamoyladenosine biosynthesis protein TsaE